MTTHPPHSDDYLVDGVIWPARACRLIAPYLVRDLRSVCEQFGAVDPEVVALVCAMERAGARYLARANASTADGGNRESFVNASDANAGAPQSAQFDHDLLSTAEVAKEVGCSTANVRDLVRRGRLAPARTRPYMFTATEARRLIQSRQSA